jgi:hypothetical protein
MSMKNFRFRPLVLWLLMGLCPPLLGHCGGDVMEDGTESGNPPVVTEQKLTLVATDAGVSVVGSVGAASPATATVRVMNVTTGEIKDGVVASDGSFEVSIAGSLQDSYSVMIISGENTTTVLLTSNGQNATGDAAACTETEAALDQRLADSFATAQTACTVDADCVEVGWATRTGCYGGCAASFVASSDADAAATRADQATADLCEQLTDCARQLPTCDVQLYVPACIGGTCQGFNTETSTCEDVASRAEQERNDAFASIDFTCQVDGDCSIVNLEVSDCVTTCPSAIAVATGAVEPLQSRLTEIEQNLCQPYLNRLCPAVLRLPCPAPIAPGSSLSCVNNRCELVTQLP